MADLDPSYRAMPPLQAIFDGAKQFGLTDEEVWQTINESQDGAGADATVPEYIDELAGALARRILSKARRIPSEDARIFSEELS